MAKLIIFLMCLYLTLYDSTQSASFQCKYSLTRWDTLGINYYCEVQNSINITSPDAAQVDSITGTHWDDYNNDKVVAFSIKNKGQIHYFPRGLGKFFRNLKGLQILQTGLKEVHQSDLQGLPELLHLFLSYSNLEIIEENLFDLNPKLEHIFLSFNKITHIDPNVFDKLTNLQSLYLPTNPCINKAAWKSQTEVKEVIEMVKIQCINSEYSKLDQKIKNLEISSATSSPENFKEKLQNLENEVKNSKFSNFFQEKFQYLKQDPTTTTTVPTTTLSSGSALELNDDETLAALRLRTDKIEKQIEEQNRKFETFEEKLTKIMKALNIDG